MAAHDPSRRAEAAVPRWTSAIPARDALVGAASGVKKPGGTWKPVEGPHLRVIHKRQIRNRTGLTGVSMGTARRKRKDGTHLERKFFYVQCGPTCRRFCIDTLGNAEAWRRAIVARAEHEMKVRKANALILVARGNPEKGDV